jgi:5-methylcytosine-specific restriction endonuclease McrA
MAYDHEIRRLTVCVQAQNRRARMIGAQGEITVDGVLQIGSSQRWRCVYCAVNLKDVGPTIDHKVPLSAGGTHGHLNIQIVCRPCNSRKGSSLHHVFLQRRDQYPV